MRVGKNFWLILCLLSASLAAASIWGDPLFYRISYALGLMIGISSIWVWLNRKSIDIIRKNRFHRLELGQVFEEQFEVTNHSILPDMWVVIEDESNLPGLHGSRAISWLGGKKRLLYFSENMLNKMGNYRLGPTKITVGDIFGLFTYQRTIEESGHLLVLPHIVRLRSFPSPTGMLSGGRPVRQRTSEVSPYAAGVRDYVPGDALNRIHWPSTFRHNQMMVKEFERDPQADVWLIVDADRTVQAESKEDKTGLERDWIWYLSHQLDFKLYPSTLEYASTCAASVANYYIEQGMAVGLCSQERQLIHIPPERGERQLVKILENIALLEGIGNVPVYTLLESEIPFIRSGSILVMITSSTHPNLLKCAEDAQKRKMQLVLILIDGATFGGSIGAEEFETDCWKKSIPVFRVEKGKPIEDLLIRKQNNAQKPWWSQKVKVP
jgi:uncharacterized protein (DUF58 family)